LLGSRSPSGPGLKKAAHRKNAVASEIDAYLTLRGLHQRQFSSLLIRSAEEAWPYHNFSESFDPEILKRSLFSLDVGAMLFAASRIEPNSGAHSTPNVGCAAGIGELLLVTYPALRPDASRV